MVMVMMLVLFMTLFSAVVPTLLPPVFPSFLATLISVLVLLVALTLPVTDVPRLVLPGPYEVHLPVARMVLVAVQAPSSGVLRRNVQIERLDHNYMCRRL